jgi:hypothetical protein
MRVYEALTQLDNQVTQIVSIQKRIQEYLKSIRTLSTSTCAFRHCRHLHTLRDFQKEVECVAASTRFLNVDGESGRFGEKNSSELEPRNGSVGADGNGRGTCCAVRTASSTCEFEGDRICREWREE